MSRDEVPEQDGASRPELGEHAVDDRRARLGGPVPRELPLGREGDAADSRAAIAGGLPDEKELRRTPLP